MDIQEITEGDSMIESILKVEGGLLRIDIDFDENKIKDIKITGDFFFFPEEKIEELENVLKGIEASKEKITEKIKNFYEENEIEASITPEDIANAIMKAFK